MEYAVTDIETTGSLKRYGKITEIAIHRYDGERVVEKFHSLINPERSIPYSITRLTGITDEMVEKAPRFYEIADRILEITRDAVFVAHNVSFDFGFVRTEFERLGYRYHRKRLCTVQLARKIFPGQPSYSLGNLCSRLDIPIKARHRANGDAEATVTLLKKLIRNDEKDWLSRKLKDFRSVPLPPQLSSKQLNRLPDATGIYYFYDKSGIPIYIGKSKNIRKRVFQHFSPSSNRQQRIHNTIADIDFQVTGSDLVAKLIESKAIKKYRPRFNRAQRRGYYRYGVFLYTDDDGYLRLYPGKLGQDTSPLIALPTLSAAKRLLMKRAERHRLCQKLCGIFPEKGACFQYRVDECDGACVGEEPTEQYNKRVRAAIEQFKQWEDNFVIIDAGRVPNERSFVLVENGVYQGYGYYDIDQVAESVDALRPFMQPAEDNREVQQIIRQHLRSHRNTKVIQF